MCLLGLDVRIDLVYYAILHKIIQQTKYKLLNLDCVYLLYYAFLRKVLQQTKYKLLNLDCVYLLYYAFLDENTPNYAADHI